MAIRHWEAFLPDRFRAIPERAREAFFTDLGEQAAAEIEELQMRLAGPDPVGEGYLEKVGRLNVPRMQAEEKGAGGADPAGVGGPGGGGRLAAGGGPPVVGDLAADHGGRRRVAFSPAAGEQLAPSGERARVDANLAALRLLRDLERQDRAPAGGGAADAGGVVGVGGGARRVRRGPRRVGADALRAAGAGQRGRVRRGATDDDQRALHRSGDRRGDLADRSRARVRRRPGAGAWLRDRHVPWPGSSRRGVDCSLSMRPTRPRGGR
jgi:hypothetical protein